MNQAMQSVDVGIQEVLSRRAIMSGLEPIVSENLYDNVLCHFCGKKADEYQTKMWIRKDGSKDLLLICASCQIGDSLSTKSIREDDSMATKTKKKPAVKSKTKSGLTSEQRNKLYNDVRTEAKSKTVSQIANDRKMSYAYVRYIIKVAK